MPRHADLLLSPRLGVWLLCVATLLAYANSFMAVPQFDDYAVIIDEPRVASLQAWRESMPGIRPLLKLSYALNGSVGGLTGFRLVNLLIHLGCVLLVWSLLRLLLRPGDAGAALPGALLFALHPVNTEAVTLLSGRSVALSTLLVLASLVTLCRGRRLLSLLAFGLACGVRETALVLPLLALLCIGWTAGWRDAVRPGTQPLRVALRTTAWHWALGLVGGAAIASLPRYRELIAFSLALRDPLHNLVTQTGGSSWLLGQLLQPLALNADPRLPVFDGWTLRWVVNVLAWGGAGCWALWQTGRGNWFAFCVLWFLIALSPSNSLLARIDVANDRQLYLAAVPLYGALALVWVRSPGTGMAGLQHSSGRLLMALLVGVLLAATVLRNRDYRSETAYWGAVLARDDANARAWNNLGFALEHEAPIDLPGAAMAYRRALALDPADYKSQHNLQQLCRRHGLPAACDEP
jgi:hypothetical protein